LIKLLYLHSPCLDAYFRALGRLIIHWNCMLV
jgi:hypothetical protein